MTGFNKTENVWFSKILLMLFIFAGLVLAVFLRVLCLMDNVQMYQSGLDDDFVDIPDYSCREIEKADVPIGIIKEYTFPVSEIPDNDAYLVFYTVYSYVDVYLNGQHISSLRPSETERFSKTGSNWTMIPLYSGDSGKEIRIEITPVYEEVRNREVEFFIGSRPAICIAQLRKDLPQLFLSVITVCMGIIYLGIAAYIWYKEDRNEELATLGLFSIIMGFWRLTDTKFIEFVFPTEPVFLYYFSITMLMIGMIPLIRSVKKNMNKISCRILDGLCIVVVVVCLIQMLLQIFGIMDVREMMLLIQILIVAGCMVIIGNVIYDRHRYPDKYKNRADRKLSLILVVGILADVAAYYVKNSSGLLFSLLAMLLYIIFTGIFMLVCYMEQENELAKKSKLLAENERQLTENRIATMISQIQPHFIYNTLGTIEQLCMEEPKKAANLVQEFSMYLRGNFTELDNKAPIRLSQELKHVWHYVNIEQIRFPDMQIEYDLKSDEFLLPALTIQPLVENAIKHGLMGLESGGRVIISTYETDEEYCVSVRDNGVGFDKSILEDGGKHIGIRNIRERIEVMCGGTLMIDSIPGTGTEALISIPKEK